MRPTRPRLGRWLGQARQGVGIVSGDVVRYRLVVTGGTVQALPGILDELAARGLRAVTASTLLDPESRCAESAYLAR